MQTKIPTEFGFDPCVLGARAKHKIPTLEPWATALYLGTVTVPNLRTHYSTSSLPLFRLSGLSINSTHLSIIPAPLLSTSHPHSSVKESII
jgi:hypothetical protein